MAFSPDDSSIPILGQKKAPPPITSQDLTNLFTRALSTLDHITANALSIERDKQALLVYCEQSLVELVQHLLSGIYPGLTPAELTHLSATYVQDGLNIQPDRLDHWLRDTVQVFRGNPSEYNDVDDSTEV